MGELISTIRHAVHDIVSFHDKSLDRQIYYSMQCRLIAQLVTINKSYVIIIAEMAVFNAAGYLIEERRRWPVITASTRGQCSK